MFSLSAGIKACATIPREKRIMKVCVKLKCMSDSFTLNTCNSSTWEFEARRPGVQGRPCLYGQSETSVAYLKPCL